MERRRAGTKVVGVTEEVCAWTIDACASKVSSERIAEREDAKPEVVAKQTTEGDVTRLAASACARRDGEELNATEKCARELRVRAEANVSSAAAEGSVWEDRAHVGQDSRAMHVRSLSVRADVVVMEGVSTERAGATKDGGGSTAEPACVRTDVADTVSARTTNVNASRNSVDRTVRNVTVRSLLSPPTLSPTQMSSYKA